jgi:ABC-type glycerol-3-phosphate transport system substrate-binding protein
MNDLVSSPRTAHTARLSLVLFSVLISILLSGCAGSASSPALITLHVWYSTDDPVERAWSQGLAGQYEHGHPNVRVQLTDYSFEDLNTKLQLALSGGNPPDLAYVTPRGPGIPAYIHARRLLDLTPAAQRLNWAARLRPGLLTTYNQPFSYYGSPKGSITAVPMTMAAVGVLYNKRLLARLHLQVPRTLVQFDAALQVAKRSGYIPIGIGNADGWLGDDWYLTLVQSLLSPASLLPEQRLDPHFSFHHPEYLRAARILKGWATKGYFTPNFGGMDAQEGVDQFFHGKTLFQMISSSENLQIAQDKQETHLPAAVFAFPREHGDTVMPQSGYLGWVVPKASAHHAQAIDFINSLLQPSTLSLLERGGFLPAHRAPATPSSARTWQASYRQALQSAQPGVYIDAAPIANLNATMEANVQLLLQGYEAPEFLVKSLQEVYATRGTKGSTARIDGEF